MKELITSSSPLQKEADHGLESPFMATVDVIPAEGVKFVEFNLEKMREILSAQGMAGFLPGLYNP